MGLGSIIKGWGGVGKGLRGGLIVPHQIDSTAIGGMHKVQHSLFKSIERGFLFVGGNFFSTEEVEMICGIKCVINSNRCPINKASDYFSCCNEAPHLRHAFLTAAATTAHYDTLRLFHLVL